MGNTWYIQFDQNMERDPQKIDTSRLLYAEVKGMFRSAMIRRQAFGQETSDESQAYFHTETPSGTETLITPDTTQEIIPSQLVSLDVEGNMPVGGTTRFPFFETPVLLADLAQTVSIKELNNTDKES